MSSEPPPYDEQPGMQNVLQKIVEEEMEKRIEQIRKEYAQKVNLEQEFANKILINLREKYNTSLNQLRMYEANRRQIILKLETKSKEKIDADLAKLMLTKNLELGDRTRGLENTVCQEYNTECKKQTTLRLEKLDQEKNHLIDESTRLGKELQVKKKEQPLSDIKREIIDRQVKSIEYERDIIHKRLEVVRKDISELEKHPIPHRSEFRYSIKNVWEWSNVYQQLIKEIESNSNRQKTVDEEIKKVNQQLKGIDQQIVKLREELEINEKNLIKFEEAIIQTLT